MKNGIVGKNQRRKDKGILGHKKTKTWGLLNSKRGGNKVTKFAKANSISIFYVCQFIWMCVARAKSKFRLWEREFSPSFQVFFTFFLYGLIFACVS